MEELKYPIGRYQPEIVSDAMLADCIFTLERFPAKLRNAVSAMTAEQLDTPYRPQGWTKRQVVHHCADSHMNSFIRFKLALTADLPVIKPYDEARWALLADGMMDLEPSLAILDGVHARWNVLLRSLSAEDLQKSYFHPEHGKEMKLIEVIPFYAWHCDHHLAHIALANS